MQGPAGPQGLPGNDGRSPPVEAVAAALVDDRAFQDAVAAALLETRGIEMRRILRPIPPMPYGVKEVSGVGEVILRVGGEIDLDRPALLVVAAEVGRRPIDGMSAARVTVEIDGIDCGASRGVADDGFARADAVCMQVVGPGHHKIDVINQPEADNDEAGYNRVAWFALDLSAGVPGD